MRWASVVCACVLTLAAAAAAAAAQDRPLRLTRAELEDKVRGGLLGQVLGNLNGLPHEFKYFDEPGEVPPYVPALPNGARTDDDTDLEWMYVIEMQRSGRTLVPEARLRELWLGHVKTGVWCANLYARRLMELGIESPDTGRLELNPWSVFNIGGSFVAETWGIVCPAMPATAAKVGVHYTSVAVDGEPLQVTQFVAAMIATAYVEGDVGRLIDAGLAATDEKSDVRDIVRQVRAWAAEHPGDWKATRRKVRDRWTRHGGTMADRNGVHLNTAATVASLIYGKGDFQETLRLAFAMGWDADNNAAACGALLGVVKGRRWMEQQQGWVIKDVYANTTRAGLPADETLTRYGSRLVDVARQVILENGGSEVEGGAAYLVVPQRPAMAVALGDPAARREELTARWLRRAELDLEGDPTDAARAAYVAIALGAADRLAASKPQAWARAVAELRKAAVVREVFAAPRPLGPVLQQRFRAAGLTPPGTRPAR